MTAEGFALFDTAIGRCGIAWGPRGVVAVHLPEAREAKTRERLRVRFPEAREEAPPLPVQRALDGITALLRGQPADLAAVPLDMERLPAFQRRVYEAARSIPAGTTVSYGDLAARLGSPGAARAVGQALGRNPFAIVVPCHRVLAAGGRMGGFSAKGGVITKARLLALESAPADGGAPAFDAGEALRHLRAADAGLARLIDGVGPFALRLERAPSLFLALAEAIVYQQLHAKAAATIFARVGALFPRSPEGFTARQVLRVSESRLLAAGLSRAKMLSLRDLARRAHSGELPSLEDVQGMEDEAIIESLSQVRGIGRWTAQMLLIFRLGRPDVLPVDDYGVRQGFAIAFRKRGVPKPADLEKRGRRWKPFRTVAAWYLWRALDQRRSSELLTKASIRPSGDQEGTLIVP